MADVLTDVWTGDPWSVSEDPPSSARRPRSWVMPVLAAIVGASGMVLRLVQLGVNARRAALVLTVAAVVWEVVSQRGAGRPWRWPALAVVAVAAEAVSAPWGGRAPALLMVMSLVVADAVLVEWSPLRSWPARTEQVASLAMFPLVGAQVVWLRTGSAMSMVVLLVVALVVVEAYHRAPGPLGAADRGLRRGVLKVVDLLAAVVVFVCAVPFLYLGGAVVRLGRAASGRVRRSGSTWRDVTADPVADAAVPFRSAPSRVRGPRNAVAVLAVTAVLVGGVVLAQQRKVTEQAAPGATAPASVPAAPSTSAPTSDQQIDLLEAVPYSERPAYAGVDWADTLQRNQGQFRLVPDDKVGFRNSDTSTRYVKVRDGLRVTPATPCEGCVRRTAWLVGGSAVFGVGQRDRGTVAAELQRLAAKDRVALRVVNLGVAGWTSDQESIDLEARLRATDDPPDVVVQLDGFNDVMAATGRVVLGGGDEGAPLRLDPQGMLDALAQRGNFDGPTTSSVAGLAAKWHRAASGRIAAAATARGARHLMFFQPDAFSSPSQRAQVSGLYRDLPQLLRTETLGRVLSATSSLLSPDVVDLRDVFDKEPRPVLLDMVHTNERGAELVAASMYPLVRASLGDG